MKTIEEILDEFEQRPHGEDGIILMDKDDIIEAMKEYAEQVIDKCAEVAYLECDEEADTAGVYVDKDSILEVKELIK